VIRLRTLGALEVVVDGDEAPRELRWRKNLALLLYLSLSPDRRRSREHLVGLFWGDKPDASARHSLNEALRVIRKAVGEERLTSVGDQVALDPDAVEVDAQTMEALLDSGSTDDAIPLMGGTFAEGFAVPGSSAFEDWLSAERTRWRDRMVEGLKEYAAGLLDSGDAQGAQETATRAVALDPFSDSAVRLLMRAAAVRGERAYALAQYDAYAGRLGQELGIEPDPETEAFARRVRNEREWSLPGTAADPERWARRLPLVGREKELRIVLEAFSEGLRRHSPTVVLVQGDSGSGKTRLGEEVAARMRLEGAAVHHVRCVPRDREDPWSALAGLCGEDREPSPAAEGALTELVRGEARDGPVLLWIDGAELIDSESAKSLRAVLREVAGLSCGLLITGTAQPPREELDDLRARAGHDLPGAALTLGPLDREALGALSAAVVPDLDADAADRLARRIGADSAGVPLLAVELLTAVALGLELDEVGGTWPRPFQTMEQSYPGDLPDSIVAAIRIGFRRLGREAQSVLAAASVLEPGAGQELLSRATGIEGEDLDSALDELEWNRWLVADRRGYEFVARIVREVVARDMLTAGQRRRVLVSAGRSPDSGPG
jgi:DNA-binding SARP family transcriptional activator